MKLAIASLMFLVLAAAMLAIRGASDWSQSFAIAWYATFGMAALLALAAVVVAIGARHLSGERRTAIVVLALPALAAVPLLVVVVLTLAPLAN